MTANQIAYSKVAEENRHNLVYEEETQRHNKQQEAIGWQQAAAQTRSAEASYLGAQASGRAADASMAHAGAAYAAAAASNLSAQASIFNAQALAQHYERQDAIQAEYNEGIIGIREKEAATARYQAVSQNLIGMRNSTSQALSVQEQSRHNKVGESISQGQLNESVRHNKRVEDISGATTTSQNVKNYASSFRDVMSGVTSTLSTLKIGGLK